MKISRKIQKKKKPSMEVLLPIRDAMGSKPKGAARRVPITSRGRRCVSGSSEKDKACSFPETSSSPPLTAFSGRPQPTWHLAEDEYLTITSTPTGGSFFLKVVAVEPASDIAVLGVPDNQTFPEHADLFEDWCEKTTPVRLCHLQLEPGDAVEALVLTHEGVWLSAEASRSQFGAPSGRLWVEYEEPILGGTSGGPIITPDGRLLGVVSQVNDVTDGPCNGTIPLARSALPQWVLARIEAASRRQRKEQS